MMKIEMAVVHEFEEGAEKFGHNSLVKEAARYTEEVGLQLQLEYPNPTCIQQGSREVISAGKLEASLGSVWSRSHGRRSKTRSGKEN